MRVALASGEVIDLGTTATAPTIGIVDYSRLVTDDYGVTTVVKRGFARRMSVQVAVPFGAVDAVQRRLADLRATSALWIADDRFASLTVRGFYKEFSIDAGTAPLSYCTLSVEGLTETDVLVDDGRDPAPVGQPSTLDLVQPVVISTAQLVASSVAENDAPEWLANTAYAVGVRVIKAATHRIYESVAPIAAGDDPEGASGKWLDVGPTNRWAMFDQALGSVTTGNRTVSVTIDAGAIDAVALLDVDAGTVRVQATGYDRTMPSGAGAITFLDLPANPGQVTVTIAAAGVVSIGTLLVGHRVALGVTEASPTAGITDFSRKVVDEFGEVTVVPRAWAKKMTANALIRTDAIDVVANRIAAVRATPSLWIGQDGLDSLTIYGFFKDFSIEVGESVSKLSLTIEGLSKAAPVVPFAPGGPVAWPDITDPTDEKPANNADVTGDNTSKDTNAVGGKPAGDLLKSLDDLEKVTIPAVNAAVEQADARITAATERADGAVADANARIAAAQLTLDGAVRDLENEIARAQGKDEELVERINALAAEGGYDDTSVRALIERAETARADGDRALANRIDTVVTSYQDLNAATNTRITEQVTALGNADQALGQRIDSVTADYQGRDATTNTRITDTVTALANADQALGQRLDAVQSSFTSGGGNLLSNTDFVTTDGWVENFNMPRPVYEINGGGDAYHPVGENVLSIYQPGRAGGPDYYADWISAPVAVSPGSFIQFSAMFASDRASTQPILCWVGTDGVIFSYAYGEANAATNQFANDPTLYRRSGGVAVEVPARAVAARLLMRKIDTYEEQENSFAWFWRPYIGAARQGQNSWNDWSPGNARAVQIATDARVATSITTLADADRAIGQRIDTVVADYQGRDVSTNARVDGQATALADARQALGQRIDTVGASIGPAVDAKAEQITTAYTTADQALGRRASSLEAQASPSGGNLVPNSALSTLDGWRLTENRDQAGTVGRNAAGTDFQLGGVENNLTLVRGSAGTGSLSSGLPEIEVQSAPFAVRPDSTLQFYALTASHRSRAWTALFFFDSDDQFIGTSGSDSVGERINAGGQNLNAWDITGRQTVVVPINATKARFVVRQYDVSNDGYYWLSRPFATEVKPGTNTWVPYSAGNDRPVTAATSARISDIDSVIADLPNRYAEASRTAALEAQVNFAADSGLQRTVNARIEDRATAIADSKAGAVAQTVSQLRGEYNGTVATVSQQAGAIVGLQGKAKAYVRLVADAGNGRAALSLWSDQFGGAWTLTGDGQIDGNLTVNGTITAKKFDRFSMSREGTSTWSGSITPPVGQTANVPWSLALSQIPPLGRFIYEFTIVVDTNAGQRTISTYNGRPYYTDYIADGGVTIVAADGQGNTYRPAPNSSQAVLATSDFTPTWTATIRNNNANSGVIDEGDYYRSQISATYTVTSINLKVTWVAI